MCDLCIHRKARTQSEKQAALKALGQAMAQKGADLSHLNDILDAVVDLNLPKDDPEANEAWERSRRS